MGWMDRWIDSLWWLTVTFIPNHETQFQFQPKLAALAARLA